MVETKTDRTGDVLDQGLRTLKGSTPKEFWGPEEVKKSIFKFAANSAFKKIAVGCRVSDRWAIGKHLVLTIGILRALRNYASNDCDCHCACDRLFVMAEVLSNYVLYRDNPQRHYRQIAAKADGDVAGVYTWEGEILELDPFLHVNPDADVLVCTSRDDAFTQAEQDHQQSLSEGWHDYTPTLT